MTCLFASLLPETGSLWWICLLNNSPQLMGWSHLPMLGRFCPLMSRWFCPNLYDTLNWVNLSITFKFVNSSVTHCWVNCNTAVKWMDEISAPIQTVVFSYVWLNELVVHVPVNKPASRVEGELERIRANICTTEICHSICPCDCHIVLHSLCWIWFTLKSDLSELALLTSI